MTRNISRRWRFCVLAASALLATNSAGLAEITELNVATNPHYTISRSDRAEMTFVARM
jgi:hypothetical protein